MNAPSFLPALLSPLPVYVLFFFLELSVAQLQGGSKLFRSRRCIMFHSSLIVEEKKKIKRDLVKGGGQAVVVVRRCRRTRLGREGGGEKSEEEAGRHGSPSTPQNHISINLQRWRLI